MPTKERNNRLNIKVLTFIISVLIIFAGLVAGWQKFKSKDEALDTAMKSQSKEIERLGDIGCIPARRVENDMGIIKTEMKGMNDKITDIKTEMTVQRTQMETNTREIIKAIKEK